MTNIIAKKVLEGTVHKLPKDFKTKILSDNKMFSVWQDITPLARDEWICWVESPKKIETRVHRIEVAQTKLKSGMRRPCCWQGCSHRKK
jgi:uncharacterized protein YdeI (YjbR/CyaY-like superfamily)